jgi:hypothetical protein
MSYVLCFPAILFLLAPCAVVEVEENGASTAETKSAKRDRYLLLDERIVAQTKNAKLTIGKVEKHRSNPLFGEDKPWERRFDNLYANVIYDEQEKIYKCWYSPFVVDTSSKGMPIEERKRKPYKAPDNREMAICYATSTDGINWVKPELGLIEYDGSKANNILWRGIGARGEHWEGPHGTGIFKDLRDPDAGRRYKAFLKSDILSVAFSADGIRWGAAIARPTADSAGDTHNNAFWSPTLGKYVGITRDWGEPFGRQVSRTSSTDFLDWKKCDVVLEGLEEDLQTYAMPVFYHGGVYLGLVAIHAQEADRVWTELTWSPDTVKWHRVLPGTPLIPNTGMEGDYDWGCVYAAASPVFLEDEIRLYYGGSDGLHTSWRNGFFCLATLRPDGFAGYEQKDSGKAAEILTSAIDGNRGTLYLSADVRAGGSVQVELLDDQGARVASSVPLTKTVSDGKVAWKGAARRQGLFDEPIRLKFLLRSAKLYSFRLAGQLDVNTFPDYYTR